MTSNNSSFEFYYDYEERVMRLQHEMYNEIKRILNEYLLRFLVENNRKATILDAGGGGLIAFDPKLSAGVTILDLFPKPNKIILPENADWIIGNILCDKANGRKYDVLLLSSVIHHLADKNNNIIKNLKSCLNNCTKLLNKNGCIYIFDGTCSPFLARLQDVYYPVQTFFFIKNSQIYIC
jgi:2-polyprenyl-3-methyl-5-hydroxy-6-metoxy-1,4-benzoquinol methylase